ncbi:MAG: GAF domain-containing protein [Anaerolineae bacterium]|nr:GAF domain-containing protein [Anaerolineae bacterium]
MIRVSMLLAIKPDDASRFYQNLVNQEGFTLNIVHTIADTRAVLADRNQHADVLVIDNNLDETVFALVSELRHSYPRLLIVLVDEEADFGMPGQADDLSTDPFKNDDLVRRITRLMSERRMETLRSDSLPAVRNFAKKLRTATGMIGKQQVAVESCFEMGYDYVAYYHKDAETPLRLTLRAQMGPNAIQAVAPKEATADDLMSWVQLNGQSRIAGPEDRPNHPLVARGRLGAIGCVPVMFNGVTYGVMSACRERPGSITQENVLMLELISSQLAAALSKESKI